MDTTPILPEVERRLRCLSPKRLRVANDFLAYLQERKESEATAELLSIPGFEEALRRAVEQAESGEVVRLGALELSAWQFSSLAWGKTKRIQRRTT